MFKKATELVYSNPDEAIKIGEHILKSTSKIDAKAPINLMISKSYLAKGDYNQAITFAFESGKQVSDIDVQTQIEINLLKSELLRILYLSNQSLKYLELAKERLPNLKLKSIRDSLNCNIHLTLVNLYLDKNENQKALDLIRTTNKQFDAFLETHSEENERLFIAKSNVFRKLSMYDSAYVCMDKLQNLSRLETNNNLLDKAFVYNELGQLYIQKKEFKKSEEMLFIALRYAGILNNPLLLEQINKNLAINYLASDYKSKHKVYNDEYLTLNRKVKLMEQEAVNNVFNVLNKQNENALLKQESRNNTVVYFVIAGLLLIGLVGLLVFVKNQWRKKRLKEIIRYLEISRSNFVNMKPSKVSTTKKIVIPEETENIILSKLKRFENSKKFLQKDMSLAVLSGQFETNTKYLSEIINKHYHDNFNTFINKLRIDFIIDKLKNDPNYMHYKISFLAEESGFSSHSSFATIFKTIVGMSPGTFIDLLREEREKSA
ncbi:MAG: helix-turn-helix domain-containing protein [Gelidibacter sp.]